ncbi:hypothetical protein BDK51DRAFT_33572 [Blyttiomyces helicus]|uniref:Uncharacterized protein n=1 Tax=Blyttiomyces helicus TaxID=388810 RepID=A0A4P9WN54_9FUNG|nr:hypothetical protein BDK51DRAFT_33572 [Blyttiomyces helicus]|eukprot:RKO94519.1 hypothetical protein BDK51DRAFT_33572 [Blyttiomyces helicus]
MDIKISLTYYVTNADFKKLNLKDELAKKTYNLKLYSDLDLPDYPGWAFLLPAVVKKYGVCPFLNVHDEECNKQRISWLKNQEDGGKVYSDQLAFFTTNEAFRIIEDELKHKLNSLTRYMENIFDSVSLPDNSKLSDLLNNIRARKEAKSQNKKNKESWSMTLNNLDFIASTKGIDVCKYFEVLSGQRPRYKPPEMMASVVDQTFNDMYNDFMSVKSTVATMEINKNRDFQEAQNALSLMISKNFLSLQTGRYFRKWSSLSPDKKKERIKSYCDWYLRENEKSIKLSEAMTNFVMDKLANKELRIMDIKWESKSGIITNINISIDDKDEFQIGERVKRVLKSHKTSRKKRHQWFQTEREKRLLQRINRLLLFEIVKNQTGVVKKERVIKAVLDNIHSKMVPLYQLQDYMSLKFDEIIEIVRSNAM